MNKIIFVPLIIAATLAAESCKKRGEEAPQIFMTGRVLAADSTPKANMAYRVYKNVKAWGPSKGYTIDVPFTTDAAGRFGVYVDKKIYMPEVCRIDDGEPLRTTYHYTGSSGGDTLYTADYFDMN